MCSLIQCTHECVYAKKKIPIYFKVKSNLKSEILTMENQVAIEQPLNNCCSIYHSQWIQYARDCSAHAQFVIRGSLPTNNLILQKISSLVYSQLSADFTVVIMIKFAGTTFQ
jgi:hypothetical protein